MLKTFLCLRVNITAADNIISEGKSGQNADGPEALSTLGSWKQFSNSWP